MPMHMAPGARQDRLALGVEQIGVLRESLDDTELTLLSQLYAAQGAPDAALALAGIAAGPSTRGLQLCQARALFALGERARALQLVDVLLTSQPGDVLASFYKAQFLAQTEQHARARAVLRELIEQLPDFPGALPALAQLSFPGPPYRDLLRRLHQTLRPRTYLEIGVEHGTTLSLASHSELAIGIDPVPRPIPEPSRPGTRLFHMTSDAFFASQRREEVLGERHVDLAFIDGMHWFEFALRDFCNVEAWCHPGSTVVLHDCLPVSAVAAERQRRTTFWVGDTWKALECLLRERQDLAIHVVPCHPSGLVIVQNLDPASSTLRAQLEALERRYLTEPYPYAADLPAHYPLVNNSEPDLTNFISALTALPSGRVASQRV